MEINFGSYVGVRADMQRSWNCEAQLLERAPMEQIMKFLMQLHSPSEVG